MRARYPAVVALAVALLITTTEAQSIDPALTAAIAARDKAAIARDVAGVAQYTADDYTAVNPSGALNTKQQRLDGLKVPAAAGSKPQQPLRTEAVQMYGAGAAVARMKQVDNRQLGVWIKNPQGWQVVAIHVVPDALQPVVTPLQQPKTPQPSVLAVPAGLSGDRAAVFAAFKQIQDAFFAGDRAAYEKATAPNHVRLSPGMLRFGQEGSTGITSPRNQPKYSEITVQVWGQVGVVRWHELNGLGQHQRLTRVFAKKASSWQQVATASSLAETGATTR